MVFDSNADVLKQNGMSSLETHTKNCLNHGQVGLQLESHFPAP